MKEHKMNKDDKFSYQPGHIIEDAQIGNKGNKSYVIISITEDNTAIMVEIVKPAKVIGVSCEGIKNKVRR